MTIAHARHYISTCDISIT